ncbi:MAG: RNA 2',3'-cyclic phosphodiesterase [Acidimicrobiales bacterium]
MRLFVAADPPEPVLRLLASLPRLARSNVRWTTSAQWHVTLSFLGEVDDPGPVVNALTALASRPDTGPAKARLGPATAWFPGGRVLQVPVEGLDGLAARVREATIPWAPEQLDFRGHLTLARARGRKAGPPELAGKRVAAAFDVPAVVLYASTLGPGASVYQPMATVALHQRSPSSR